jgi:hypothetical protein
MTSSCLSAATSPAISSRIAHESLLQDFVSLTFSLIPCKLFLTTTILNKPLFTSQNPKAPL